MRRNLQTLSHLPHPLRFGSGTTEDRGGLRIHYPHQAVLIKKEKTSVHTREVQNPDRKLQAYLKKYEKKIQKIDQKIAAENESVKTFLYSNNKKSKKRIRESDLLFISEEAARLSIKRALTLKKIKRLKKALEPSILLEKSLPLGSCKIKCSGGSGRMTPLLSNTFLTAGHVLTGEIDTIEEITLPEETTVPDAKKKLGILVAIITLQKFSDKDVVDDPEDIAFIISQFPLAFPIVTHALRPDETAFSFFSAQQNSCLLFAPKIEHEVAFYSQRTRGIKALGLHTDIEEYQKTFVFIPECSLHGDSGGGLYITKKSRRNKHYLQYVGMLLGVIRESDGTRTDIFLRADTILQKFLSLHDEKEEAEEAEAEDPKIEVQPEPTSW